MKKTKKLIPILIVIFIFGIYFIGKNIKFENNIFKIRHLASLTDVKDPNLKACITAKEADAGSAENVTFLDCSNKSIYSLEGIDYLPNLQRLSVEDNYISDLTPLKTLNNLVYLVVDNNLIKTIDLSNIPLEGISANGNYITDINSIKLPTSIDEIQLSANSIAGEVDLSAYTALNYLLLNNNKITSLKLPSMNFIGLYLKNNNFSSINDITANNISIANAENGIKSELEEFNISNVPWDADLQQLIINNKSNLMILGLPNVGMTDASFFKDEAGDLPSLVELDLSYNTLDISKLDLTDYALETFTCDTCGVDEELNNKINKAEIQNLYIPNNNYTAFHTSATDFPKIKIINIAGNKIAQYTNDNTTLKELDLSYNANTLGEYLKYSFTENNGIEKYGNIEKLYLRNIGLNGDIDFSKLTDLKELYLDNTSRDNINNVSGLTLKGNIEVLDVSNNESFSGIEIPEVENGTGETVPGTLEGLRKLTMNFTGIDEFKVYRQDNVNDPVTILYPNLEELSVIGCNGLNADATSNDLDITTIKDKITKLGIALSGLGSEYRVPASTSLREIIIDSSTTNTMLTEKTSFPNLGVIRVAADGTKSILTSKSSIGLDNISSLTPNYVSNPDYIASYNYFTDVNHRKSNRLSSYTDKVHYRAKQATISTINGFDGHTAFDAYYALNIAKISSSIFSFDDDNMIVFVGDIDEDEILNQISLPVGFDANIEDGKLIVTDTNNQELGRYTISHLEPNNPGDDSYIDDETPGSKDSVDPLDNVDDKDYGTTDNPKTGAIISFIAIVLLIAGSIIGTYYIKLKKQNEELIEKI